MFITKIKLNQQFLTMHDVVSFINIYKHIYLPVFSARGLQIKAGSNNTTPVANPFKI